MPPAPEQPDLGRSGPVPQTGASGQGGGGGREYNGGNDGGMGEELVDRIEQLLIDRATQGLDASGEAELSFLLLKSGRTMDDGYELLAAELDLGLMASLSDGASDVTTEFGGEKLPVQLRNRILAAGDVWLSSGQSELARDAGNRLELIAAEDDARFGGRASDASRGLRSFGDNFGGGVLGRIADGVQVAGRSASSGLIRQNAGWLTAAACLVLALIGWFRPISDSSNRLATAGTVSTGVVAGGAETVAAAASVEPVVSTGVASSADDPSSRLARLISEPGNDLRTMTLAMTSGAYASIDDAAEPLYGPPAPPMHAGNAGPIGQVIWSSALQTGFVKLSGLPPLTRPGDQYQLWLVDALRDADRPVPACVFDVPPGGGELVLPVNVAVRVDYPVRVHITVERSGGSMTPSLDSMVVVGTDAPASEDAEPAGDGGLRPMMVPLGTAAGS